MKRFQGSCLDPCPCSVSIGTALCIARLAGHCHPLQTLNITFDHTERARMGIGCAEREWYDRRFMREANRSLR